MKIVTRSVIVASLITSPAFATESESEPGAVVIGIVGDIDPMLAWREFDPATGKLKPFRVTSNLATGTKTQVSELFSMIGRLGKSDKRYRRNAAGVSYRIAKLPPGFYVLEAINTGRRRSLFEGTVPVVQIIANRTTYAGDHGIQVDAKEGGTTTAIGRDASKAQEFLLTFPDMPDVLGEGESGTATLRCFGKGVAFADQLVCDSERSAVSDLTLLKAQR